MNNSASEYTILILENDASYIEQIKNELARLGAALTFVQATSKEDFQHKLVAGSPLVIVANGDIPSFEGAEVLAVAKKSCPGVPVILVGEAHSEGHAVQLIRSGADDFIERQRLHRLVPAISRTLERARVSSEKSLVDVERVELERQVVQLQKMEALGQFASGVAHDFNNILTGMIGQLGLMRRRLPSEYHNHIIFLNKACERASDLVSRILAFARNQEFERKEFKVSEILTEIADFSRAAFGDKIEIKVQDLLTKKTGSEPLLLGSSSRVYQVLLNLCVNARDAILERQEKEPQTKVKKQLEIKAEHLDLKQDDLKVNPHRKPGAFIVLSVSDSGMGIPPEVRDRIFEPFFTTKPVGKGTGLGLSVVYGVAKDHGGWVECESQVGSGTTFKVYLSLETESNKSVPVTTASVPRKVLAGKVLLVEDNDLVSVVTRELLEELGLSVVCSKNGTEAQEIFLKQQDSIKILITDIQLPGCSGIDLSLAIRERQPELKVLFTSGNRCPETLKIERGATDFIYKPFSGDVLAKKVRALLGAE